ncbi:pyridoxamine 5'-phosphate oxidase family protein [Halobacteria archaeon AArc-curdl1]|uniref:Pyridoxamine 5'-phosphate oxidase family protein n=1 Tax=Natronosalvus hydrolyticus TaxID=2979988 RepID=A0AAP3E560_9EURY|nr:pyridoxamine 5'-phosphate oxidase family protein [Halobacteria archaeon AArc-curdl1]
MSVDELREYGLAEMDDDEMRSFLASQKTGVLGLPGEGGPYLLPLSYRYNGNNRLYFTFLLGSSSRKETLSEGADAASFLVYKVDTMYNWESVLLSGTIDAVPESEWGDLEEPQNHVWQPSLFEEASLSGSVKIYEFRIEDLTGIKHQGLPPALQPDGE